MTKPIRLLTVAPGHFHAALVQRVMIPGIQSRGYVYGELDADTVAHLERIAAFNARAQNPTNWELDARLGPNYFERFLREQPGTVVVLAGRNQPKIDRILAATVAGLNVLADKPWAIELDDLSKIEQVFHEAELREVVVGDLMTERHEITAILQRELMRDPAIFGAPQPGTPEEPGLVLESTHFLVKAVSGVPVVRPAWWFDVRQAGDGLADVGTHLADLALWLLFPDLALDYRRDVRVLDASRWPTPVTHAQFQRVTGLSELPEFLQAVWLRGGQFLYYGNGTATIALGGVHVRISVAWDVESEGPGLPDAHAAIARGTQSIVAVTPGDRNRPELEVVPLVAPGRVLEALRKRCEDWQPEWPGIAIVPEGNRLRVSIPDAHRTTHEEHFTTALREFVRQVQFPRSVPSWERPNLLAKYYITLKAVELARHKSGGV